MMLPFLSLSSIFLPYYLAALLALRGNRTTKEIPFKFHKWLDKQIIIFPTLCNWSPLNQPDKRNWVAFVSCMSGIVWNIWILIWFLHHKKKLPISFSPYINPPHTPMRGSTQREALATRSVEKNLEQTFAIVTPPILVPTWPYWWELSNGTPFQHIWYHYGGANKDLVPRNARKHPICGLVKLDTQCLVPFCNNISMHNSLFCMSF